MKYSIFQFAAAAILLSLSFVYSSWPQDPHSSSDAAEGARILRNAGCGACHAGAPTAHRAPSLERVGARLTPSAIRGALADSLHLAKNSPSPTPMPDCIPPNGSAAREKQIDDLLHFLVTNGGPIDGKPAGVEKEEIHRGKLLYQSAGCVACHDAEGAKLGLFTKTTRTELTRYLLNPREAHPGGRMPSLALTEREARDISAYLLEEQTATGGNAKAPAQGLKYQIFKGAWEALPDFGKLTPDSEGVTEKIQIPPAVPSDHYGVVLLGTLTSDEGEHTFWLTSDDGSRLILDGKELITNDGIHPEVTKSASITLTKGAHGLRIEFFENEGGEFLNLQWKTPSKAKLGIPPRALAHEALAMAPPADSLQFSPDAAAAGRGRAFYENAGCAACHPLPDITNKLAAKSFDSLDIESPGACFRDGSAPGAVHYNFSELQQKQIRAALANKSAAVEKPADELARLLQYFQCTACHTRDGAGGPSPEKIPFFTTLGEAELGDEGRLPPTLSNAGRKLKSDWIAQVLTNHGTARPYMATRMPQFGVAEIARIAELFPMVDEPPATHEPEFNSSAIQAGRAMVDAGAFSCISCHKLANNNSLGIPAVDLANTTKRIRYEWFRDYMLEPATFRPGTRMPQFWPEGKSVLQRVLDGNTQKQIEALWIYLALGDSMPLPKGLKPADLELRPLDAPIVFRTFFKDVGPRAICIGFPEGVNCVFDAATGRLAKLWKGRFVSAAPAWVGRAGMNAEPLNATVLDLPAGNLLSSPGAGVDALPGNHYKFGGYSTKPAAQTSEQPVVIHYELENITIHEGLSAKILQNGAALHRTISFDADPPDINIRIAAGRQISRLGNGRFQVDGPVPSTVSLSPDFLARFPNFNETTDMIINKSENGAELYIRAGRFAISRSPLSSPSEVRGSNIEVIYEW